MPAAVRSRIITLLTDFGLGDHFAGVMKGVIAGIAPRATVVDISHDVQPYQLNQARFLLAQSWPYFPKGAIHVCVVDPGVGSTRRPIVVEAGGHLFIGPDNGLFSGLLELKGSRVREITNAKLTLKNISNTFHGRDIFAPVAAHLAAGTPAARVGRLIHDATRITTGAPIRTGRRFWSGEVVHIDRFGNLITNLPAAEFPTLDLSGFTLRIGLRELRNMVSCYTSAQAGEAVVLVGSSGNLEVAMNQESAAKKLGVGLGAPVELEVR